METRADRAAQRDRVAGAIEEVELADQRAAEAGIVFPADCNAGGQRLGDVGFGTGIEAVTGLAGRAAKGRAHPAIAAGSG